jgi:hypothetical protein
MMLSGVFHRLCARYKLLITRREIDFTSNGKEYKLIEKPAVLLVRYVPHLYT